VIPQLLPPPADRGQGFGLLVRVRLLEDADLVVALTPDESAVSGRPGVALRQPCIGLPEKLFQGRCRHGCLALRAAGEAPASRLGSAIIACGSVTAMLPA